MISNIYAIIPAAGSGQRMQVKRPKQYIFIGERTILEHSVMSLLVNPRITHVIIAIIPGDNYFTTLALAKHPKITVVNGGKSRTESVLAGIQAASKAQWVIVHDAVRPCLHQDDLTHLLSIIEYSKVGGILAVPVCNTLKCAKLGSNEIKNTIDRVNLWHALTPQLFPRKLLYKCLLRVLEENVNVTDEASALEYCGFYPELIEGRNDNIKVTYQEDLQLVKFYLYHKFNTK